MRVAEPQLDAAIAPDQGVLVRRFWQKHLLTFLMIFGPGLIVMEADNDAGAVSTYLQAGGQYGLHLLWLLIVLLPICYFEQEMVARLGIVTGRGHAAMIYERFGKWWGHFFLLDLLVVNFLTLITEFAAISLALSALGVSPWISVPYFGTGACYFSMVVTGSYLRWERDRHRQPLIDLTWFALAYVAHPKWADVAHNMVMPAMPAGGITGSLVFWLLPSSASTIAPCSFSTKMRVEKRAAILRPEMGQARYADWRNVHRSGSWRHDVGRQLRLSAWPLRSRIYAVCWGGYADARPLGTQRHPAAYGECGGAGDY